MKTITSTKATYRGVHISVLSDRIDGKMMYCCQNGLSGLVPQEKWFPTQGEAIASERHEIDRIKGFAQ